jgi:hypothetical protein
MGDKKSQERIEDQDRIASITNPEGRRIKTIEIFRGLGKNKLRPRTFPGDRE